MPVQVTYLLPGDAPSALLDAIFAECYARWGGIETLIVPMTDGGISAAYWLWLQNLDPDIVYSYMPLDGALLDRLDREVMPTTIKIHRSVSSDDFRPHLDEVPLPSLSALPTIAETERFGIRQRLTLLSNFMGSSDEFIADSFGFNPLGPGWVGSDLVRRFVATCALGSQAAAQPGHVADEQIQDATALLGLMSQRTDSMLTMAQVAGTGYGDRWQQSPSPWSRSFNIIVGDTLVDRIAFWNSRIGHGIWQRQGIVSVRVPSARLSDDEFISSLAKFISRWNRFSGQNGPSWATVRSSSVSADRLSSLTQSILSTYVHTSTEMFDSVDACAPDERTEQRISTSVVERRTVETPLTLAAPKPSHLERVAVPESLSRGCWVDRVTIERDGSSSFPRARERLMLPRRWQAVRALAEGSPAKADLDGNLRFIVAVAGKPPALSIPTDDTAFVAQLFTPRHYLYTIDPRNALIPGLAQLYPRTSSAGRHLLGFLERLGNLTSAYAVLGDPFWKTAFNEMAIPREAFDDAKRAALAQRLQKRISKHGPSTLEDSADFMLLADVVARAAPNVKVPIPILSFERFVDIYREVRRKGQEDEHVPTTPSSEGLGEDAHILVERELRARRLEGVLLQGYRWRCDRCLHWNWVGLQDIEAVLNCEICKEIEHVPADFRWSFLLDDYIARGLRERGLRGLIWILGDLSMSARDSFFFAPPLDLYEREQRIGEVDIACSIDGKFVIGEVKESGRQINEAHINRLVSIGEKVRPNTVVLACLDPATQSVLESHAQRIRSALASLGVEVVARVPATTPRGPVSFTP